MEAADDQFGIAGDESDYPGYRLDLKDREFGNPIPRSAFLAAFAVCDGYTGAELDAILRVGGLDSILTYVSDVLMIFENSPALRENLNSAQWADLTRLAEKLNEVHAVKGQNYCFQNLELAVV